MERVIIIAYVGISPKKDAEKRLVIDLKRIEGVVETSITWGQGVFSDITFSDNEQSHGYDIIAKVEVTDLIKLSSVISEIAKLKKINNTITMIVKF